MSAKIVIHIHDISRLSDSAISNFHSIRYEIIYFAIGFVSIILYIHTINDQNSRIWQINTRALLLYSPMLNWTIWNKSSTTETVRLNISKQHQQQQQQQQPLCTRRLDLILLVPVWVPIFPDKIITDYKNGGDKMFLH